MAKNFDDQEDDLLEDNEDIDRQLDWEEELELKYGSEDALGEAGHKNKMGPGFSKQKQVMEASNFYQKKNKSKNNFKNRNR